MIKPSYSDLMEKMNKQKGIDIKISSPYTIVIASSKRARQLIDGDSPLASSSSDKPVSIAINEFYKGKLSLALSEGNLEGEQLQHFPDDVDHNVKTETEQ